jgi:hypothetical protein
MRSSDERPRAITADRYSPRRREIGHYACVELGRGGVRPTAVKHLLATALTTVLVVGCSSTHHATSTDRTSATTTSSERLAAAPIVEPNAPPCPARFDDARDAGPAHQASGEQLVPFDATLVRICVYDFQTGRLHGGSTATGAVVRQIEADANSFTREPSDYAPTCPPTSTPLIALWFYTPSSHGVGVWDTRGCDLVTNGTLVAQSMSPWRANIESLSDNPGWRPVG